MRGSSDDKGKLMTKADLTRIGDELGISLPQEYCDLMLSRAEELKAVTYEINGETCTWFEDSLFLNPEDVIDANRIERKPDSGTGCSFPKWWEAYFLIGTDGGGGFYCLRLNGKRGVFVIGSDSGDKPQKVAGSLDKFVEEELEQFREETEEA
jgi:hypothetical protein